MNILVVGGAGYIGSHTTKALAAQGMTPIVLDNLSTGHAGMVRWGPLVRGDAGDRPVLRRILLDYEIDGIIHFAASAYVGESMDHPRRYFQNNVVNSLTLLEEALDVGIKRIVFSSSCATYGVPSTLPIAENHPQCPVNPYGESKLFIERALRAFETAYGLDWVALRYFNAAGADPGNEIGERHDPETHLIPLAIATALGDRTALDVYGSDYATIDGTPVRDFVHVSDLAVAHVRALQYLLNGGPSIALNLGTGRGHTVREVVSAVEEIGGRPVPLRMMARRPGDPPALVADATLARHTLGWKPVYPDLKRIIGTAWAWHTRDANRENSATGLDVALTGAVAHHD
ncbi:MAG: UDP-glucose 4-epimerase GalE [Chloroflexota bacterium]|nr:UDP-glucose 4-epimerase GalE [Chloroflexota bacterium]